MGFHLKRCMNVVSLSQTYKCRTKERRRGGKLKCSNEKEKVPNLKEKFASQEQKQSDIQNFCALKTWKHSKIEEIKNLLMGDFSNDHRFHSPPPVAYQLLECDRIGVNHYRLVAM